MKRAITSSLAALILIVGGGALAAHADIVDPPTIAPATTCMNCK